MRLDEALHICLDLSKTRHDLGHAAIPRIRAEQLQARHLPLLGSEITNADEVQDRFRKRLRWCEDGVRSTIETTGRCLRPTGHSNG
jgi:hypothetical protein